MPGSCPWAVMAKPGKSWAPYLNESLKGLS